MMYVLIGIALKSLLIAVPALGLLRLMVRRSAAQRSLIAHIALFALILITLAPIMLPSWPIEAPALPGRDAAVERTAAGGIVHPLAALVAGTADQAAVPRPLGSGTGVAVLYAVPAILLLGITLLALGRLVMLRARAEVLVDGHWLSALARAQRRMGIKHGTALLTSNDVASPVSWGLMRPVILLNRRAVEALDEAEAIIAHELAHVARLDWAKLLLARVATALFWFNPFVWMLAREAHQLREEAADDAVLGADVADADYAELLVGVARHECRSLFLGAHGVAPARSSLARRIARILDGKAARAPVTWGFGAIVLVAAAILVAPIAALTLTPSRGEREAAIVPPGTANSGVAVSAHPAAVAISAHVPKAAGDRVALPAHRPARLPQRANASDALPADPSAAPPAGSIVSRSPNGAGTILYPPDASGQRATVSYSPNGAMTTTYPADSTGKRKVVARSPNGAMTTFYQDAAPGH
jgi:beta-lactamase regulating signal transducer with metallopeptidase domain